MPEEPLRAAPARVPRWPDKSVGAADTDCFAARAVVSVLAALETTFL